METVIDQIKVWLLSIYYVQTGTFPNSKCVQQNPIKREGKLFISSLILLCVHAQAVRFSLSCPFLDWIQLDTQKCSAAGNVPVFTW